MADQEENRNHKATPFKLAKARGRGQVAKSAEVAGVAVLAAFLLVWYAQAGSMARRFLALCRGLLGQGGALQWSAQDSAHWFTHLLRTGLELIAPLLLAIMLAAFLANRAQVGSIFSFHPLKPDFSRLNPARGFRRLLSLQLVYQAGKSLGKAGVIALVMALVLHALLPRLNGLSQVDPRLYGAAILGQVGPLLVKLLMVGLVFMAIDLFQAKRKYAKDMRMSHREVVEEHKQRDGDPRIRNKIRQLRQEFLKKTQALRSLPDADVLVTNPTHYAVAIAYKHGDMPAPKLLAKGAGGLALKMRAAARRLNIPVVEHPPLARALYRRLDNDQYLPEDLYPQTARILLWVYALREARQPAGA